MSDAIHGALQDISRFWPACAAIGACRHFVGVGSDHLALDGFEAVCSTEHGWRANGYQSRREGEKRSKVGNCAHLQAKQLPVVLKGCLDIVDLSAAVCLCLQILTAALDPLHRPLELQRHSGGYNLLAHEGCFGSVAAAHFRIMHVNTAALDAEEIGQSISGPVDSL